MCIELRKLTEELVGILDQDNSGYCWIKTYVNGEWEYGVTDSYINELVHQIRVELEGPEEEKQESEDDIQN